MLLREACAIVLAYEDYERDFPEGYSEDDFVEALGVLREFVDEDEDREEFICGNCGDSAFDLVICPDGAEVCADCFDGH